ncbi:MAG TPA: UbiD family decarboxylase [Verrucomicrobiae bacterium]|nr:UbiD family decarboxylase [Verrucomicrobiae bacterium]
MGYRNLAECLRDLEKTGQLRRVEVEIDPRLEMAAIQRRVYRSGGPALLFTRPKGCRFAMAGNIFGTMERTRFIFRDALADIELLVKLKVDPRALLREPWRLPAALPAALHLLPKRVRSGAAVAQETTVAELPELVSWPMDGGPFVTLPQVYSESPDAPGFRSSNLGMYRVQLSGNSYRRNSEVGLHYQIHRGIGVHHAQALRRGERLPVNIFVGGPPSMTVAAVMPLPEGMPELSFAGLLGGHRIPMIGGEGILPIPAEADFCISGYLDGKTLPEGPFGDHLGYYSLVHDFPVLTVEKVYHRPDAVWPFTTVGRPPQEDTSFGAFIHDLTAELMPTVLPGVRGVHAVDAAGVHPLLLAVGSERYTPFSPREPMELLTQASAILGQGQLSLAKYLFIAAEEDSPPDLHHISSFLRHVLERGDWRRDVHFHTGSTIDTLDYSGSGLNRGSKVVIAAAGEKKNALAERLPPELALPEGFSRPQVVMPGVMAVQGPAAGGAGDMRRFCGFYGERGFPEGFRLLVVCDDSRFVAESLDNFLWVAFTRSDPAADLYGIGESVSRRHWGCSGPLLVDARVKPHHAPPLEEDPATARRVEELAARGGPLQGLF